MINLYFNYIIRFLVLWPSAARPQNQKPFWIYRIPYRVCTREILFEHRVPGTVRFFEILSLFFIYPISYPYYTHLYQFLTIFNNF